MTDQFRSTNVPTRAILEGVPCVGWDERASPTTPVGTTTTFALSLRACMEFMSEGYSLEYIMGTSGAAFRLLWWKPGWAPDNLSVNVMARDRREPFRHVFEATGYAHDMFFKEGFARAIHFEGERSDDEAYFRGRIIESIRKGRPVLACGVIGPPEWCVIAGYEDYGDILMGWNYFQNYPGAEFEPSGYFRKRDWFKDTEGLIIIGEKQEKPPSSEIYRKALKWALEVVQTPVAGPSDRHSGLAAYTAWAEALLRDEDFPADDGAVLYQRLECHDDNANVLAEGRWCASQFLKQIAKDEPGMAEELLAAASCYEAEYNLMHQGWNLLGDYSSAPRSEDQVRKLAEPTVRRQIAPLILQARDKDAEAADHIERALAK